jgi:hypothetical protein
MINGKVIRTGGAMLAPEDLFDIHADNTASLFPSTISGVQLNDWVRAAAGRRSFRGQFPRAVSAGYFRGRCISQSRIRS